MLLWQQIICWAPLGHEVSPGNNLRKLVWRMKKKKNFVGGLYNVFSIFSCKQICWNHVTLLEISIRRVFMWLIMASGKEKEHDTLFTLIADYISLFKYCHTNQCSTVSAIWWRYKVDKCTLYINVRNSQYINMYCE